MPIFDFACTKCGFSSEVRQGSNDPNLKKCPQCQEMTFEKQLSSPAFHLKGSGFYKTDYQEKRNQCGGACSCHSKE